MQNLMDYSAEVDRAFQELEWDEILSTLEAAMFDVSQETPISPPPPSPPPPPTPVPAAHPQPGESLSVEFGGYTPLGAAPHMAEQPGPSNAGQTAPVMDQGPLYGQSAMWSWPYMPYNPGGGYSLGQLNNVPVVSLPQHMYQELHPIQFPNGEVVYLTAANVFAPPDSAPSPEKISTSKKRKRDSQQDEDRPYVKKPLNAFMLYRKEQRANVAAELNIRDSATINKVLGQKWKSLPKEEQTAYYVEAEKEKLLHILLHPDWSARDNYGKSKKSKVAKTPRRVKKSASAATPEPSTSCSDSA